jgi:hypothetical protein
MLSQDVYIQRLARSLEASPAELAFLQKLSADELALMWAKIARTKLRQHPYGVTARGA